MLKLHVHVFRFFPTNHFKCNANASTISKDTWGQLNPMQPSPPCGAAKTIQIITKKYTNFHSDFIYKKNGFSTDWTADNITSISTDKFQYASKFQLKLSPSQLNLALTFLLENNYNASVAPRSSFDLLRNENLGKRHQEIYCTCLLIIVVQKTDLLTFLTKYYFRQAGPLSFLHL